jgi:hypothetical protein
MADRSATPEVQRFQTLLGLMLSRLHFSSMQRSYTMTKRTLSHCHCVDRSQTRDQATAKAMRQLQSGLTGGVSVSLACSRFPPLQL